MNSDEILKKNLDRIDAVFAELRKLFADPSQLNLASREIDSLRGDFGLAIKELFAAKNVIHNAQK